jgi:hypothetical protein
MLKPTIFISYKRHHQPTVEAIDRLEVALRTAGFEILRDVKKPVIFGPMTSIGGLSNAQRRLRS